MCTMTATPAMATRAAPDGPADVPFGDVVTSLDQLQALYRPPAKVVASKKIDHVDDGCRALIAAAPFVVVATAGAEGRCTVSPKGGPPGFVAVLDKHRLAVPDYGGNNLVDSLRNLLVNPHVGLLFVLPGRDETLRVEGRAWVTTDTTLLDACTENGLHPKTAIGVQVESAFIHCAQSLRRGRVWDPASWEQLHAPPARDVFKGHLRLTMPPDDLPDWADHRPSCEQDVKHPSASSKGPSSARHT